jgi:GAF domain-containing protein
MTPAVADSVTVVTRADGQGPSEAVLAELSTAMLATESLEEFLLEVAQLAAGLAPGLSCGITVATEGRPLTVASSDVLASGLDEVQYGADTGPCLDTMRTGTPNSIVDLHDEHRWESYVGHAIRLGVRSSIALPLPVAGTVVGALNLYSPAPAAFDDSVRRAAANFAGQAAAAVGMAMRFASQVTITEQLRTALTSRSDIDQAMGIIMANRRCTSEEAFAVLREASQHRNVRLREVARELLTSLTA